MNNRLVFFAGLAVVAVCTLIAFTPTQTGYASVLLQDITATSTLPVCAPTATGTSMFPTISLPTLSEFDKTSTPCPGGTCPTSTPYCMWGMPCYKTATPYSTVSFATPTVTGTPPTGTPTLTTTPDMFICGPSPLAPVTDENGNAVPSSYCQVTGKYIKFGFNYDGPPGTGLGYVWRVKSNFKFLQDLPAGTVIHVKWNLQGGAFGDTSSQWINLATNYNRGRYYYSSTNYVYDDSYAIAKDTMVSYAREITYTMDPNLSSQQTIFYDLHPSYDGHVLYTVVSGTMEAWIDGYSTPTPIPTVTATGTPQACRTGESIIDENPLINGDLNIILTSHSCYTLVPAVLITLPSPDWVPFDLPDTLGVPGVELCVNYYSFGMTVFNLNVAGLLGTFCALIGAIMIYREMTT